uniref:Uncharacterized protein n=1 Tax=Oryza nivara TaxID=4536 RepID=A0A0E0HPC3_ORYNI
MAPLGGTLRLCGSSWEEATSAGVAEQAAGLTGGGGRSSIALVGEGSAMERDEEWSECYGVNVVVEDFDNVGYGGVPGQQNSGAGFSSTKRMTSHMSAIVVVKSTVTSVALVLSLWYRTQSSCSHKRVSGMGWSLERNIPLRSGTNRSGQNWRTNSSQVGRANGMNERARSLPCSRAHPRETAVDPAMAAAVGSATAARRRWARATSAAVGSATAVAWGSVVADPVVGKAAAADPAMRRVAVTDPEAVGSATAVAGRLSDSGSGGGGSGDEEGCGDGSGGELGDGPTVRRRASPPARPRWWPCSPSSPPASPSPSPVRTSSPSSSPSRSCSARRPTPSQPALGWVIPSVVVALLRPLICDADAIISAVRATQVPDQTKLINAVKEAGGDHVRR